MARSNGWSAWRIRPSFAQDDAGVDERIDHGKRAERREDDELPSGIRVTPAGNQMNVRTIGSSRPTNTVAAPYCSKNRSASSISCGADQQVPAVALQERPAALGADRVRDERAERVPDRRHDRRRSRSSTAAPVSGSIWLGSETRNPAYGRISSDGSGIIADSIAIASHDAEVPERAVQAVRGTG